jgi:hypothetical protein
VQSIHAYSDLERLLCSIWKDQQMDDNPTLKEMNDFICLLNNDATSLILEDREVLTATVKGTPERLTDVTSRLAQGRKHLRSLDKLYEAAEDVCCDACERAGA